MSQNRTVFPGMEDTGNYQEGPQNYASQSTQRGTVFPGSNQSSHNNSYRQPSSNQQARPLVGFLYSLSRTGFGEYWPLYIGANVIGRDEQCDVVLAEGTVSKEHATIVVRMLKNPKMLDASISDERSSHGTMINGESISATRPRECKNGDIIEVGENYKLYLVLIDSAALGLTIAPDFVSVETDQEPPAIQCNSYTNQNSYQDPSQQHGVMGNDMPFFNGPAAAGGRPGTVGLDNSDIQKGGTEF